MRKHYMEIVRAADRAWDSLCSRLVVDEDNFYSGALDGMNYLTEPGTGTSVVHYACMVYSCSDCSHYHDSSILPVIEKACDMLLRTTHEDGTFDYLATNFYSPAIFELVSLCRGYEVFEKNLLGTPEEEAAHKKILAAIERLANGCLNGGFHTPNHRWVYCSALLMSYNILHWPELLEMSNSLVSEGIDCDEYGEFTERSIAIYNPINVNSMLIMSEVGNMPELERYAKLNLDLTFMYLEEDGTLFTRNSRRRDNAQDRSFPAHVWYTHYLWAGYRFNEPKYLKMADFLFEQALRVLNNVPGHLWIYFHIPELRTFDPDITDIKLPTTYHAWYPNSNILRCRKEGCSYTLVANQPDFLHVKFGERTFTVRMCASFFAVAQFAPKSIEKTDTGYRMQFSGHGEYKGLFSEPPETSNWFKMDHTKRPVLHSCDLDFTVDITDLPDGLAMDIRVDNTPRVPWKMEFVIPSGTRLETNEAIMDTSSNGSIAIKQGDMRLEDVKTGCEVTVRGLFAEHMYHTNMRGSVPPVQGAYTVYVTGYSPLEKHMEIHFGRRAHARSIHADI